MPPATSADSGRPALARLTPRERDALDILYVAPFAPADGDGPPPMHPQHGRQPLYHYEIHAILKDLGLRVTSVSDLSRFVDEASRHNYVFTLYNRGPFRNSEIFVSTICEFHHLAYLGAPPNMRALAEDKHVCKGFAASLGLQVPAGRAYGDPAEADVPPPFPGPYFVKPRFGAASEDVTGDSAVTSWAKGAERVRALLAAGKEALVEPLIEGTDVTVPVLGGSPPTLLPAVETMSEEAHGIVTHRQKRAIDGGRSRRIIPVSELPGPVVDGTRLFLDGVKPFDYVRVDFRHETATGAYWFTEFNQGCSLSSHMSFFGSINSLGVTQAELVEHLLAASVRRQKDRLPLS